MTGDAPQPDQEVAAIKALPHYREPRVGEDVCVPSALHLSHGEDDFAGGLCQIAAVNRYENVHPANELFVSVVENPGTEYSWLNLMREEPHNLARYGDRRGRPDPDHRPEFNQGWSDFSDA